MSVAASWVPADNGNVPNGAVCAGINDGDPVYVARVQYEGKSIPGLLIPSKKKCVVTWDGDVVNKSKYEVRCSEIHIFN